MSMQQHPAASRRVPEPFMATLLLVDSSGVLSDAVVHGLEALGHLVTREKARDAITTTPPALAIDVALLVTGPNEQNVAWTLQRLKDLPANPEVVVLNAGGGPEEAERAIRGGAWDYLETPVDASAIGAVVSRVMEYRNQRTAVPARRQSWRFDGIVGSSSLMRACVDLAAQAADSDASILITGETGTGKEIFASAIHANSSRSQRNFVVVDCAALPENLVDSTLLGHERGAFTGADRAHVGLIKQADGGTLFLDEIGELPLSSQKSFLRVLQEHRFRPVGGKTDISSDFRIIAASNRNLEELSSSGAFRKDLLFRVRAFTLDLPPLRDRPEDIIDLIHYHVPLICERMGLPPKDVSGDFLEIAKTYTWPGNVRELVNALERSVAAARHDVTLFSAHLPNYLRIHLAQDSVLRKGRGADATPDGDPPAIPALPSLADVRTLAIEEAESQYLRELVGMAGNDIVIACTVSGLSRSRLYALLKKYRIPLPPR
jgi:two-component system, NtrC family, response regulator